MSKKPTQEQVKPFTYYIKIGTTNPKMRKVSHRLGQVFEHLKDSELVVAQIYGSFTTKTGKPLSLTQKTKAEKALLERLKTVDKYTMSIKFVTEDDELVRALQGKQGMKPRQQEGD